VRVPAHDLVADPLHERFDVEVPALLGDARLEYDLKQQIPQLFAQRLGRTAVDRLQHLVGLLDQVGAQRREGLLTIPGTAVRPAQPIHDLAQSLHLRHGFLRRARPRAGRGHLLSSRGADATIRGCSVPILRTDA